MELPLFHGEVLVQIFKHLLLVEHLLYLLEKDGLPCIAFQVAAVVVEALEHNKVVLAAAVAAVLVLVM
jgi:hypothetical protein